MIVPRMSLPAMPTAHSRCRWDAPYMDVRHAISQKAPQAVHFGDFEDPPKPKPNVEHMRSRDC